MSDEEKKYCNILGLNTNYTLSDVENAYKTAKEAWSIDESAPEELKQRSKVQSDKIDEAYEYIKKHFKEQLNDILNKEDKLIETIKQGNTNTNPSNEEYSNFNIETTEIEFNRVKIRNWWRIILIIVIFFFICFNVSPENSSETSQNQETSKQQNLEQNTQNDNAKHEVGIQKETNNSELINENNKLNIEEEKTKQNNEKELINTQKNSVTRDETQSKSAVKTEYIEVKQNMNNSAKKEVSTSKSDFNAVSDYFD